MLYHLAEVRSQVDQYIFFSSTLAFAFGPTQPRGQQIPRRPISEAEVKPLQTAGALIEYPVWRNGEATADEVIGK